VTLLAAGLALVVGLTLGLLGGGGAVLTVPILVYVVGVSAKAAVPLSLVVVGISAAVGAAGHWRAGRLVVTDGLQFALFAMVGAFMGAKVGLLLPERVQLGLFGAVVLLAALAMWRSADHPPTPQPARSPRLVAAFGVGVGLLAGVIGIGGGFLFVPVLVSLLQYSLPRATAVSMMVIALISASALLSYGGSIDIPWNIAVPFIAATVIGLFVGIRLAPRVPADTLKRVFSIVLLAVGSFVLYQNLR
jgi:uncharacterized membrane protein YfcA